jgi:lysophospholipase L1-like esterase
MENRSKPGAELPGSFASLFLLAEEFVLPSKIEISFYIFTLYVFTFYELTFYVQGSLEKVHMNFFNLKASISVNLPGDRKGNGLRPSPFALRHLPLATCHLLLAICLGLLRVGNAKAQTRIMPLGNSITAGTGSSHGGGYRLRLYDLLSADPDFGRFDFVGQLESGFGLADREHEGHRGYAAGDLNENVGEYLSLNPADIVLLEIGTNDVNGGRSAAQAAEAIGVLVDRIHDHSPETRILLGTLVPRVMATDPVTDEVNLLLHDVVNSRASSDFKIQLVPINARFKEVPDWHNELMRDNLHPNDRGYEVMAQAWYKAITGRAVEPGPSGFLDEFDRISLGPDWYANDAFRIEDGQLVNTSAVDTWDHFLAICNVIADPDIVEISYGSSSDDVGRSFTGIAVMLDALDIAASGYLIFHNFGSLRLWTIENGGPNEEIAVAGGFPEPRVGDILHVEISSDRAGHHFDVYRNGERMAVLSDPSKRYNGLYSGIMINGNTLNGVDYFYCVNTRDFEPPGKVTDLKVVSTTFSTAVLQWTAPGNNGVEGKAARYDIRYSTENISTDEEFSAAKRVEETIAPSLGGVTERLTVFGLESGTTYFFALKAFDEMSNASKLSNEAFGTTAVLTQCKDDFNRADGNLGGDWGGELNILQIRNNAVENVAVGDLWSLAVYKSCRNVQEVTIKYGPKATPHGINFSGIVVMADAPIATASGYFIQHFDPDTPNNPSDDVVRLWLVQNGRQVRVIDEGRAHSARTPKAGSRVTVSVTRENNTRYFYVYVDATFDRILSDPSEVQNGLYAGFMLESTLGEQNAVDEFIAGVAPGNPKILSKVSGDNQAGSVGQTLPQPLTVALIDSFDNALPGALVKFSVTSGQATVTPPPSKDNHIRLEAEDGQIIDPLEKRGDAQASGGKYIVYPIGQTRNASATFRFEIKKAGTYRIWTRNLTNPPDAGSWTISVDSGPDFTYDVFQGTTRNTWTWDLLSDRGNGTPAVPQFDPKTFNFGVGEHIIIFKARWEDTRLDKILITPDSDYTPNGKEETGFVTDAEGLASATVNLGNVAGPVTIQASHGNLLPVKFSATTTGGAAEKLVMNSGSGQSGPASQALSQPFKVKVQDKSGNPVAGHPVTWVVTTGSGTLSQYTSVSDFNGIASTTLTLGNVSATNTVEARAGLIGSPIVFTATTISGVAANAAVISGNSQTGTVHTTLPTPLVVKVTTASGQPVANFPVEFRVTRGGGSLSPNLSIANGGFELANIGANTPANWNLEGGPSVSEVSLSASSPHNGMKSLQVNSSRNGIGVSQTLNYPVAGSYALTFWAKVISGTARVTWSLSGAAGNAVEKIIDITPAATGNTWMLYVVTAENGLATPRNLSVKAIGGASNFLIDDVKIMRNTDSNGEIAVSWTLGDTAGTHVVQVEMKAGNTTLAGSPVTISATAKPGPAKKMVAAGGNKQIGSAGQPLNAPLVVKITDEYGNGIASRSAKFAVKAGGGKLNGNQTNYSTNTDRNGLAQATLTLGSTTGDTNKVQVTSDGINSVLFTALAAIPSQVTKVPAPAVGSAGNRLSQPLVVRVMDIDGKRISGYPVVFKIRQGNGTINNSDQAVVLTDSLGEARTHPVLGPIPGASNKIEAWINYNGQTLPSPALTFVVKAARLKEMIAVSGNNQTGTACEMLTEPFKVKIVDSLGVGIKDQAVTFTVTRGGGKLGSDTVKVVSTDGQGIAQIKLTLGPKPGTNQVTAKTATTLANSPQTLTATGRIGSATVLQKVSGDSLFSLINTELVSPQVVRVTDKCGNGIANINVKFTVKAGGGKVNGKDSVTVLTETNGKAQVTWKLGSVSGTLNNRLEARAFNGTKELTNSPLIFSASATPNAARSIKAQGPTTLSGRAGMPTPNDLIVKVTDNSGGIGNGVPNHPVRFVVVRGGGQFSNGRVDTTMKTDANGLARVRWILGGTIGDNSQEVRAIATNTGLALEGAPISFWANVTPGPASAEGSEVQATGPIPADGSTKSKVTVSIRDRFGNPLRGQAVIIIVSPSGTNIIDQPTRLTDDQGKVTGAFATTNSGTKIVTARVLEGSSGIEITRGASVEVTPLAAQSMSLVGGNNQTCNTQAAASKPLSIKVGDKFGNGVPNHEVRFTVKGSGRIYESPPIKTDAKGIASATYIGGTSVGQHQIWAESQGLTNSPVIFIANVVTSVPRQIQQIDGNAQSGQVGQNLPKPLVVRVTDKDGRPVFGVPVKFDVTFGGGAVDGQDPLITSTNELGEASAVWRLGSAAGPHTVRVESDGLTGSPIDFRAQAVSGAAEIMSHQSGQKAVGEVGKTLEQPLCVRVTDSNGNGVDNVEVFFELLHGSGSLSPTEPLPVKQVMTQNGGFACVQITFGKDSGWRQVRASAAGLRGSPVEFYVYGKAWAAQTMTALGRTNNQSGTKGKLLNFPLQVLVQDRLGNPVPNEAISFLITAGGGDFNGNNPLVAKTDSNGIASAPWTLGRFASENEANAVTTRNGVQPSTIVFKATGFDNNFPIFEDAPDRSIKEGDAIEFAVIATDPDGDPLSYGAKNLPPGAQFDSLQSRIFRWRTDLNSGGHYEVSFLARDNKGGIDEELVIIDVKNRNQWPVILSRFPVGRGIPTQQDTVIDRNASLLMRISAIDPDNDPLHYRWFLNGKYAGSATNTYLFHSSERFNTVEVLVFDQEDTASTSWMVQVPVKLNSFSAALEDDEAGGEKHVKLEWQTASESNNIGFNVLRSAGRNSQSGRYEKINQELIPARRDGHYIFVDDQVEAGGRYFYKLEDVDGNGIVTVHGPVAVEIALPKTFVLEQNYPNPFNPTTHIRYALPRASQVTLAIYNSLGQEVRRLVDRRQSAGYHLVMWDGRDERGKPVPSGIYHYRLQAGDFVTTKKMVMAK